MNINVFPSHELCSKAVATEVINMLQRKPTAAICFATGHSPQRAYQLLIEEIISPTIDVRRMHLIALDEWLGVSPVNPGSCHHFLKQFLIEPLQLPDDRVHLFDAFPKDELGECEKMNRTIDQLGGIDLMIVGVGMNGHIGFNEPGADVNLRAHVAHLDSITQSVGKKYFSSEQNLTKGITLGLADFFNARRVLMMANGTAKASIVQQLLEGPITNVIPASLIRKHKDAHVFLDHEAASLLKS